MFGRGTRLFNKYLVTRTLFNSREITPDLLAFTDSGSYPVFEKILPDKRSQITLNSGLTFIMAAQPCGSGAFGRIYHAFTSTEETSPSFCVKQFDNFQLTESTDYNQEKTGQDVIGRSACLFTLDECTALLTEWQPGIPLRDVPLKQLVAAPPEVRLKWLRSLFQEVKRLHDQGYAHMDLHGGNLILDLENGVVHIIDFGLLMVKNDWNFCIDIEDIHFHIQEYIFRDVFDKRIAHSPQLFSSNNEEHPIKIGIINLIAQMQRQRRSKIPFTCDDGLDHCDALLSAADSKATHRLS